jgi:DNA-binding NarL/FixJ family response regulator
LRELQILRELSQGSSNKAIARTLDISEDGIKFHPSPLPFQKLTFSVAPTVNG